MNYFKCLLAALILIGCKNNMKKDKWNDSYTKSKINNGSIHVNLDKYQSVYDLDLLFDSLLLNENFNTLIVSSLNNEYIKNELHQLASNDKNWKSYLRRKDSLVPDKKLGSNKEFILLLERNKIFDKVQDKLTKYNMKLTNYRVERVPLSLNSQNKYLPVGFDQLYLYFEQVDSSKTKR